MCRRSCVGPGTASARWREGCTKFGRIWYRMLMAPCFDELEIGVLVVLADPGRSRATGPAHL